MNARGLHSLAFRRGLSSISRPDDQDAPGLAAELGRQTGPTPVDQ